jgi:two-component system, NarL family, nitrate/nitrite response regulator NarL
MDRDARPDAGSTGLPAGVSGRGGSVSVLVVDDSPVFRRGMGRAVEIHAGLELLGEADGGEAAVEAVDRLRPDVVLLDLRMPDLDGLEVLERLRELDRPFAGQAIIVSASLDPVVERAALAAGATTVLSKDLPRADICAAALRAARP